MNIRYVQKENGLYILGRKDIEQIATANLRQHYPMNLEYPKPLNAVEYLEECLGLRVKYAHLGLPDQGILGATVMCDVAELIECDAFDQPTVVEETYGTVIIHSKLQNTKDAPRRNYTLLHGGAIISCTRAILIGLWRRKRRPPTERTAILHAGRWRDTRAGR